MNSVAVLHCLLDCLWAGVKNPEMVLEETCSGEYVQHFSYEVKRIAQDMTVKPPQPTTQHRFHTLQLGTHRSAQGTECWHCQQGRKLQWLRTPDTCWRWWLGRRWTAERRLGQKTPQTSPQHPPDGGAESTRGKGRRQTVVSAGLNTIGVVMS